MAALLATGGSTNHLIHWVAVARAAGIVIDWNDFSELSDMVPLLTRVYPNGSADVNAFQAAGGPGFVIGELVGAGLMHADVLTVRAGGIANSPTSRRWRASRRRRRAALARGGAVEERRRRAPVSAPFSATGGLKLLRATWAAASSRCRRCPTTAT
jgi:phosphogluconate dehydratase